MEEEECARISAERSIEMSSHLGLLFEILGDSLVRKQMKEGKDVNELGAISARSGGPVRSHII